MTTLDQAASVLSHDEDRPDVAVRLSTDTTGATVLLAGDLDRSSARRLDRILLQLYRDGYQHVVLDLSGVRFLDLAVVDVLARAAEQFRAAGREFVLRQPTRVARRVLEVLPDPHATGLHAGLRADELLSTHLSYPRPETVVCTVTGEVDLLTTPLLAAAIWYAVSRCTRTVVVDLTAVRFFSAKGLEVLVQAAKAAHGQRILAVAPDGGPVAQILEVPEVAELIPRHARLCGALAAGEMEGDFQCPTTDLPASA
ncbi:MAG: STAS domain-containing protein [Actinomycetota bacterium]|nr:STAS domain-containing protein [Actinomycetota bacterium]